MTSRGRWSQNKFQVEFKTGRGKADIFVDFKESFPAQSAEIADVSLVEGACCNYSIRFASPRNRTQEADG
jgi:hypothetical protein